MKISVTCHTLCLVCLLFTVIPAVAQTDLYDTQTDLYDNGPIDGNTEAWTVNFGFIVTNSFTLEQASIINTLSFGAWLFPGDVLETADISITSEAFGGTTFYSGTVPFTQSGCVANGFGFNVCTELGSFTGPFLNTGTYWLNMQNAVVANGDPVYWDENRGPSSAYESSIGSIPSESFTLAVSETGTTSTTSTTSTSPEPSSIMLFGSGILGVAGILRRKV